MINRVMLTIGGWLKLGAWTLWLLGGSRGGHCGELGICQDIRGIVPHQGDDWGRNI